MKTTVFQIKTRGEILDGMSYVILCGDGSTLVVDGGMPGDGKILVDLLKKITGSEKPVIDAWFFTHNHLDHTGAFFDVAEKFSDQVRVKKIVHRFLSEEFYANCQPACVPELKRFTDDFGFFPGVEIVMPLAGDVFHFGSAKIEILYTSADLPIINGGKGNLTNDTSLVFRLYADSQNVLFTGDIQKAAERVLIEKYGAALKSDVCQISHHVDLRSDTKFFSYVDPEIVLWPTGSLEPKLSLTSLLTSCDPDRTLMYDLHVRDVFIAGFGTVRLEMPIRPSIAPFFGGSIDRLKNCEPEGKIAYRHYTVNLSVSDPVWDSLSAFDLDYPMGFTEVRSSVKFFWNEKGIGVKTSVCGMDAPAPSEPGSFDPENCCCARIHFSELAYKNFEKLWSEELFNAFRGLVLYPEKKDLTSGPAFNSSSDRFFSDGRITQDGFEVSCFVPFKGRKNKGDLIGIHVEARFNKTPGEKVRPKFTLARGHLNEAYRATPSGLCWFVLG